MIDVPQPALIPEDVEAEREVTHVEGELPRVLAELDQRGGLVLAPTEAPPPLHLPLGHVQLLR